MIETLTEPLNVNEYITEYYNQLVKYENIRRNALFVKYLNINLLESTVSAIDSAYDRYHTNDIKFDLYDFTPVFYMTPVSNSPVNNPNVIGSMIDGMMTVTLYTISNVRINDLIAFYPPVDVGEIFRVNGFRTQVALTKPSIKFYEVYLEYAPVQSFEELTIANNYVYDLTLEGYLRKSDYDNKVLLLKDMSVFIEQNIAMYYSLYKDLYVIGNQIPIECNYICGRIKEYFNNAFYRINCKIFKPYAIYDALYSNTINPNDITLDYLNTERTLHYYDTIERTVKEYYYHPQMQVDNNLIQFTFDCATLLRYLSNLQQIDSNVIPMTI